MEFEGKDVVRGKNFHVKNLDVLLDLRIRKSIYGQLLFLGKISDFIVNGFSPCNAENDTLPQSSSPPKMLAMKISDTQSAVRPRIFYYLKESGVGLTVIKKLSDFLL